MGGWHGASLKKAGGRATARGWGHSRKVAWSVRERPPVTRSAKDMFKSRISNSHGEGPGHQACWTWTFPQHGKMAGHAAAVPSFTGDVSEKSGKMRMGLRGESLPGGEVHGLACSRFWVQEWRQWCGYVHW